MLATLIHLIVLLLLPPLLLGIINRTKAVFAGRRGAPLLQSYYDIAKLLRRGFVISTTTTWIFIAAPIVTLLTVFAAGLLVPIAGFPAPLSFTGDVFLFAYLLALGRFFTTAAALDTGSSFEGMGAAREVTFACLSEPALFLAVLVLARHSGSLVFAHMLQGPPAQHTSVAAAALVLVAAGLFIVLLAETCRIPVDDPNTHLELTMIHEVMVLDHGGPLLGLVLYGAAIKMLVLQTLLLHIVAPFQIGNAALDGLLFIGQLLLLSVGLGVVESTMARLRMRNVPYLLAAAILLCGSGFLLLIR
jgi:formate hydrogenlyase subunit 4